MANASFGLDTYQSIYHTIIGQSNENGIGGTGGMLPGIGGNGPGPAAYIEWAGAFANANGNSVVSNRFSAIQGISLPHGYCGLHRGVWSSGTVVQGGNYYNSSDGGLWKVNQITGFSAGSTTEPTGTSNVTLNTIPWVYMGAINSAIDVLGHVYRAGERGFDPNNYLSGGGNAGISIAYGYKERWVTIANGQSEALLTTTVTQQVYEDALKSITDFFLGLGVDRVFIGLSCYGSTAGMDAYYLATLQPALANVLASYAGNPKVAKGVDLRATLGILPVQPAPAGLGLMDSLHMNDFTHRAAGKAYYDRFVALGLLK